MPDTPSYVRAADSAATRFLGISTEWNSAYQRLYGYGSRNGAAEVRPDGAKPTHDSPVTLKGRSVYYGALLHLSYLAGSLWLAVLVQSLLAALCVVLSMQSLQRALGRRESTLATGLIGVGLAAVTPLAFFTSYLMPDVFGGFTLLALVNILFLWPHQSKASRIFWLVLLTYSLLVHNLNLTVAAIVFGAALVWRLVRGGAPGNRPAIATVACMLVAMSGNAAFHWTVTEMTGEAPVRPPFIAMRLIADGPGQTYLKRHCGEEDYIYCRYKDGSRLHSDTLLWSKDPSASLFRGLSNAEQRRSSAEEQKFALAVFLEQPLAVLGTSVRNGLNQLLSFNLVAFNYSESNRHRFADSIPAALHRQIVTTRAYAMTMPVRWLEIVTVLVTGLALAALAWLLLRPGLPREVRRAAVFLLFAVVVNAGLCGALSGPKGRYQMRIVWVVPLLAAGLLPRAWERSSRPGRASLPV